VTSPQRESVERPIALYVRLLPRGEGQREENQRRRLLKNSETGHFPVELEAPSRRGTIDSMEGVFFGRLGGKRLKSRKNPSTASS